MHQLAESCAAAWREAKGQEADFPAWDPACLDLSQVKKPNLPEKQRVDGPPPPLRHPEHFEGQWLLFHLKARPRS